MRCKSAPFRVAGKCASPGIHRAVARGARLASGGASRCEPDYCVQESAHNDNQLIASEQRMKSSRPFLLMVSLAIGLALCASNGVQAKEMSGRTKKIHGEIPLNGATLQQARLAILQGMYFNKGLKLIYEGETPNSVTARWDYRGGIVIFDVRYDEKQIQILYRDASEDFECKDLQAGVCHDGTSRYYNYMPNFKKSIRDQLARIARAK
jgi:hypothetical protein